MLFENRIHAEYVSCIRENLIVSRIDPLNADALFAEAIPLLNEKRDTRGLIAVGQKMVSAAPRGFPEPLEAMAAVRDLGMLASSLNRHDIPLSEVSSLEETLLSLSDVTGEVPADTVTSYGPRNPVGFRMRTFTGTPEETEFVSAVGSGMRGLPFVVEALEVASGQSLASPFFPKWIRRAARFLSPLLTAMRRVRNSVTPEFFTVRLRPFFEPKVIGGRTYLGAGGAQSALVLIDMLMWGCDEESEMYQRYMSENLEYQPRQMQVAATRIALGASICSRAAAEPIAYRSSTSPVDHRGDVRESLRVLDDILELIMRFRLPHLGVAEKNMAVRPQGSVGSGGYTTDILKFLIDKTREARDVITLAIEENEC